jgi:hypothetical protein
MLKDPINQVMPLVFALLVSKRRFLVIMVHSPVYGEVGCQKEWGGAILGHTTILKSDSLNTGESKEKKLK